MKHTYKQAKKAMNNLINYFGYRKSDFYDDGEDIICVNYEDCELPTWDVYTEDFKFNKVVSEWMILLNQNKNKNLTQEQINELTNLLQIYIPNFKL